MDTFENEKVKDTDVVKCKQCGADMRYSIKAGALKCAHCGSIQPVDNEGGIVRREITNEIISSRADWNQSAVFRCDSCGARVDMDKGEIVKKCPFCMSSNILKSDELCGIQPDSVVPFTVAKKDAGQLFKKWLGGKFYVPGKCKKMAHAENVNGLYFPTWSFSADTRNAYNGMLGEDYEETSTDSDGNTTTTTHTRWFRVSGNMNASYRDFLVPSGKLVSGSVIKQLGQYPIAAAKSYKQEYLVGRSAEHYSRDINVCFGEFGNYIYSDLCERIRMFHRADHVGRMNINVTYDNKQYNYVLLPAYIANFSYKRKNYNFYVNGATGKIVGKYPVSGLKIFFTVLGIMAAVVAAAVGALALLPR